MVQVVLTIKTDLRHVGQVLRAFRGVSLLAQAEPGLISARLLLDSGQPAIVCYIEEKRVAADLDGQIRSSRYRQLLGLMEEAIEPPELRLNWVTETKGLEYLEVVKLGNG